MTTSKASLSAVPTPAARFVDARLRALPLSTYPGHAPKNLTEAYAIQEAAIDLWPDKVGGWKVGYISPEWRGRFGVERLVGPIFRDQIRRVSASKSIDLPVFSGGFTAVEAEFVFRIGRNASKDRINWTTEDAQALVSAMHVGIEIAGSPFAGINELGPLVTVSDFGNNAGLIVGPSIEDWSALSLETLSAETFIDGVSAGRGSAANVTGGPIAALVFVLENCARRRRPLLAGQWVSTGATTGVHVIKPGQSARVDFGAFGQIQGRAVKAEPQQIAMRKQA